MNSMRMHRWSSLMGVMNDQRLPAAVRRPAELLAQAKDPRSADTLARDPLLAPGALSTWALMLPDEVVDDALGLVEDVWESVGEAARRDPLGSSGTLIPALYAASVPLIERRRSNRAARVANLTDRVTTGISPDVIGEWSDQVHADDSASAQPPPEPAEQRQVRDEQQADQALQTQMADQTVEVLKARQDFLKTFLGRESIGAIIGGVLMLLFGVSAVVAMFKGTDIPELFGTLAGLVFGYFFGQQKKD